MFNFRSVSLKIAALAAAATVLAAGAVAVIMEFRLTEEMSQFSHLKLLSELSDSVDECNVAFTEAIHSVSGIKYYLEGVFDVDRYKEDAGDYFDAAIRPGLNGFMINTIDRSTFVAAVYFAVHPDLTGSPFVCEAYFAATDNGIEASEPQSYEDYMQVDSEDMEWFYGAYNSGQPYWTSVYLWEDTTPMVSYVEPIRINGNLIGVIGVDILIDEIETFIQGIRFYETGFSMIEDNYNDFFGANALINALDQKGREEILSKSVNTKDSFFSLKLGGKEYVAVTKKLVNGFTMYAFAPSGEVSADINASLIRFLIIFVVLLSAVIIAIYLIGRNMGKPLSVLIGIMKKASVTGDVTLDARDTAAVERYSLQRDEVGQSIAAAAAFFNRVREVSDELESVASGDMTVDIKALSDKDTMGLSLHQMTERLNSMFSEIKVASQLVSAGARQIADGSHSLAQSSTEQATSVQELSGSISEMAGKTTVNAQTAGKASVLTASVIESSRKGSAQMADMQAAVKDISDASIAIGKIIKTIDDIAFQTNILALNAAVEAARAGQHGKGFAVVAEEVRSLAAKSANAAKETGAMIQNSMDKAKLGVRIADETSQSFSKISSGITESSQLIEEIAESLREQTVGIGQINTGIDQVSQVTQQTSATAEESAAASSEMNDQSKLLQDLLSQFKLKDDGSAVRRLR